MLARNSLEPWETVYRTSHEIMERTPVEGGFLYRNWLQVGTDTMLEHITMVFVPKGPPIAPINIDVPAVTGIGAEGETLTCTTGNWDGEPTGYSYQWRSAGLPVGTDSNTYVVAATDVGNAIDCVVTATNATASVAAPPSNSIMVE